MVESNPHILDMITQNQNPHIRLLYKPLNVRDLISMSQKEHYDVVLALSILHHFRHYEKVIDLVFELGDQLFIELPAEEESVQPNPLYEADKIKIIYERLRVRNPEILLSTLCGQKRWNRPLMFFQRPFKPAT